MADKVCLRFKKDKNRFICNEEWYLDNKAWWETIISGEYQNYYEKMYGNR